ncbi:sialate O-acetylesterase [Pedobacter sp. Leaf194]|uniref:sialate O-acetylesterase n=1 Tax=Pedobacter sp. Leaf194 TaxID=1736297 RepID=UPI000702BFD0|nr:sialate O-acetylesterase [Pedobacter sp. Leaf194]KQS37168.1 hypothetical protein ASG14_07010 [Pedobacter sp. Leaf194]
MSRLIFLVLFGMFFFFNGSAKIIMPGIFADNMVLQQKSQVAIWGKGKTGAQLTIITSWDNKTYSAKINSDGLWRTKILTPAAGGPFWISISDGEKITLKNILIGEVWLCSGQSNMEMALRGNSSPILNSSEIILNADNKNLRLFTVGRAVSLKPEFEIKGDWVTSDSESARNFSALAFQFGQILQKKLNVPVGIIVSSIGGTMIESWMSKESLEVIKPSLIPVSLDTVKAPHKLATTLFNGMIAPLSGFSIKGFVWYQGESNRHEPALYAKLFPSMIENWRKNWGLGELPFYYVQIAPFGSSDKTRSGPKLREAQLKTSQSVANTGMVCALDVGMENDIHFMDKTKLAQRLSYWALGDTYGIKGINFRSPEFKSLKIDGNKAIVSFNYAPYLTSYRKEMQLFEIAGEDRVFYQAKAEIKANEVLLTSEKVKKPVSVRYAFKEWVMGELFNNDGIPASSFRTDDW